ncbi:MAG: ABC transporter ATP-binding protein, partial [Clostridiales Family XIII bacterium]|nr:ABC transporter ATP-binding protein [Clostridiales Family XIII bacterium]
MSAENSKEELRKIKRRRKSHGPGGPGNFAPPEKAKDFKGTVKMLVRYMSKYKVGLFFVALFAIASTVFNIVGPKILARAITELFNGLVAKFTAGGVIDFDKIGHIMLTLLLIYAVSAVFGWGMSWIMSGITQKVGFEMRANISEKIHKMPMKYFESNSIGDVLSRITNDVDTLIQGLNMSMTQLITSTASIIGIIIMMLTISWKMTIIALVMLPLSAGVLGIVIKMSQKYFKRQQDSLGEVNGQVEETIAGLTVIKLFNHEEESKETFDKTNEDLFRSAWKSQFFSGISMPALNFVGNLGYVGIVFAGAIFAFKGTITVGDIQAFIQYV